MLYHRGRGLNLVKLVIYENINIVIIIIIFNPVYPVYPIVIMGV